MQNKGEDERDLILVKCLPSFIIFQSQGLLQICSQCCSERKVVVSSSNVSGSGIVKMTVEVLNKLSNKTFNIILEIFKDFLPEGNHVPESIYDAKKLLGALGLRYILIHACKHDCIHSHKRGYGVGLKPSSKKTSKTIANEEEVMSLKRELHETKEKLQNMEKWQEIMMQQMTDVRLVVQRGIQLYLDDGL